MSDSGYYRLNTPARETLYALFPLAHDVEITVFGEDGRDTTFAGKQGDLLVLKEEPHGDWVPTTAISPHDAEDVFVPVGDAG